MRSDRRLTFTTVLVVLVLLAPFTLLGDPGSALAHRALLLVLGLLVGAVWWRSVLRWGPAGALVAAATAVPILVLVYAAVLVGVWPVPDDSLGLFVYAFPLWVVVSSLLGGGVLHLLAGRQASSGPERAPHRDAAPQPP